jgi:7-cyano-7-deazaguanine synthase
MTRTIAVVSGGLDSVTMAYKIKAEGELRSLLSVDYGQRHRRELEYAESCAANLGVPWEQVNLRALRPLLGGSALTDSDVDVPEGHYAAESMRATVVPNRNAIMLSVAVAAAISRNAQRVAIAVHAGDHYIYPDCRPEFLAAFASAMRVGNEGFIHRDFAIDAPFLWKTKADIVKLGHLIGVPFDLTWSCYSGRDIHCGACGTCVERREAFILAAVEDPTRYETLPAIASRRRTGC